GAWPAMSIRAALEATTTGRGSCGSGLPRGFSMQIRQARISRSKVSSASSMEFIRKDCFSGRSTWARGHFVIPAAHMVEVLRQFNMRRLHELHRNQTGDVRNGKMVSRDERASGQFAIEKGQKFQSLDLVCLAPLGNLRDFPRLHGRVQMAESRSHRHEEAKLHAPLPHLHT